MVKITSLEGFRYLWFKSTKRIKYFTCKDLHTNKSYTVRDVDSSKITLLDLNNDSVLIVGPKDLLANFEVLFTQKNRKVK